MRKGWRKFWTALFGLIAAIVGGRAVYVSFQDNTKTATDGGVVMQGVRGSPVIHIGSGDINQGIQHKGQGDIAVGGDVRIGRPTETR